MLRCVIAAVLTLLALASPAVAAPALPLGHAGRWVTDAQGRVVVLHGHNMVYKRPPYTPARTGFGDDDAAFLAAEGYNNVRVGVIYGAVEPAPGVYDEAYLDSIAATVASLGRHGVVSLLDFHQDLYHERFQGEGWPEWAVQDDGLPPEPKAGFPANYLVMPALQRAFDHFWDNSPGPGDVGLQDRYAAAWRHVARRFRDDPNVFGYDLLNEPWPGSTWQQCANPVGCPVFDAKLEAFSLRVIKAIREVDPETLIYYEPHVLFNDGVPTTMNDLGDERLGFSFHDYCLPAGTTHSNEGCDPFDDIVFANAEARAAETGDAPLLTEFAATDSAAIISAIVERADRFMVGWQHWHYCPCDDPTTSGPGATQAIVLDPAKPPVGDNLKAEKLQLLSRPYPQVIAGTPRSWRFDAGQRTFTARWSVDRAGGGGAFAAGVASEIVLPARQYPSGYAVAVEGGRVASEPGARLLRVVGCEGAGEVAVTVTPAGASSNACPAPSVSAARARLRVTVRPRVVRAGRRVRLRVQVTSSIGQGRARPRAGARVHLRGHRAVRTGSTGRAVLRVRFRRAGRYVVRVSARGAHSARAVVRVRRARTPRATVPAPARSRAR